MLPFKGSEGCFSSAVTVFLFDLEQPNGFSTR